MFLVNSHLPSAFPYMKTPTTIRWQRLEWFMHSLAAIYAAYLPKARAHPPIKTAEYVNQVPVLKGIMVQ